MACPCWLRSEPKFFLPLEFDIIQNCSQCLEGAGGVWPRSISVVQWPNFKLKLRSGVAVKVNGLVFVLGLTISAVLTQHPNGGQMTRSEYEQRVQAENEKHGWGEGALKPGQQAPDFELKQLRSGETVRLSALAGREPVALVFGTYTCPIFRGQFRAINDLAAMYKDKVEFVLIYVREAHPSDALPVEENVEQGITLPDPATIEDKQSHALTCIRDLNIRFTTVVDEMDNKVEQAYSAWPTRLYLVGRDGKVAWKSKPGPKGFIAAELAVAIENELER